MSLLINPRDMDFVLYELLDAEHLTQSDIYADLDRDTFNAVIDTAKSWQKISLSLLRRSWMLTSQRLMEMWCILFPKLKRL